MSRLPCLCLSLVLVMSLPSFAGDSIDKLSLPQNPSQKQVEAYLQDIRGCIAEAESELRDRAREVAMRGGGRVQTDDHFYKQLRVRLAEVPTEHVEMLCQAAVRAENKLYRAIYTGAVSQRNDFTDQHKAIILKFLPDLPNLVHVVEKQYWAKGAEDVLAAGWKEIKKERTRDGNYSQTVYSYARTVAKHGIKDAVIVLAEKFKEAPKPSGQFWANTADEFQRLVPNGPTDLVELAKFVLKNKKSLEFMPENGTYRITAGV